MKAATMNTTTPPSIPNDAGRVLLPSLETPTLTKAELAELLFERLGLNKRESKDMVEAFSFRPTMRVITCNRP